MKNILKRELVVLWSFSVILGLALIVLDAKNKLPLGAGDFVFISILALCVALYRPKWIFFLFVSLIPLESTILASGFLPIQLRPYQFAGAILTAAVIILWIFKRLNFKLLKPTWIDWLIFSLVPFSFLSLVNSPNKNTSLKNNLILISFAVLFYLVRNFVRSRKDLIKSAIFFVASNIVVLAYGFYQVFADKFGIRSFEVMFGRPNSTFTEPDWLGIYLCFGLAALLVIARERSDRGKPEAMQNNARLPARNASRLEVGGLHFARKDNIIYGILLYILVFFNLTLLVLTLSRSAWIGAAMIIFFFLAFSLYEKEKNKTIFTPRKFVDQFFIIFVISLLSIASIHFGKLSKFDIFDRARSTATSEQKITIACEKNLNIPAAVSDADELQKFNCQHINLEDINSYKAEGKYVTEIFRKDPNVMTRSQIYKKSFEIIREHPAAGVGFGTITQALGTDERGAGLNESNIFLQIWAGTGILGLIAFASSVAYIFIYSFRRISPICLLNKLFGYPIVKNDFEKATHIFVLLGVFALFIPNLFNAGLFMGLFWLGLGVLVGVQTHSKAEE